jgi:5,10-methylenetetrahydromethanopterin reductase
MTQGDASRLGVYVMPGPATDTLSAGPQALEAERLGLGAVWYSELQGPMKDAGAVLGYLAHATSRIRLGTSISHFGTRSAVVQASWGLTMQALSGGRFEMGLGRGVSHRWHAWGVPVATTESMGDHADILRRLWRHENVTYDGPAGTYPNLYLGEFPDIEPPPLLISAMGPNSLRLAGRKFDGVFLTTFLSVEGLVRSREVVHAAAAEAGRDPSSVRIIHSVVVCPDSTDEEVDKRVRSRIAAYLVDPEFGSVLATTNGWDMGPIEALRKDAASQGLNGETPSGRLALIEATRGLPQEWLDDTTVVGTAAQCAAELHEILDAGADEIIVHGTTSEGLTAMVEAFAATSGRPATR